MDQVPARHWRFLDVDAVTLDLPATDISVTASHGAWCLLDTDAEPPCFYFVTTLPAFAPDRANPAVLSLRVEILTARDLGWRIVLEVEGHAIAFLTGGELASDAYATLRAITDVDVKAHWLPQADVLMTEQALQDELAEWLAAEALSEGGSLAAQHLHREALLESGTVSYWTPGVASGDEALPAHLVGSAPFEFLDH